MGTRIGREGKQVDTRRSGEAGSGEGTSRTPAVREALSEPVQVEHGNRVGGEKAVGADLTRKALEQRSAGLRPPSAPRRSDAVGKEAAGSASARGAKAVPYE